MSHTPGPWQVCSDPQEPKCGIYAGDEEATVICDVTDEDTGRLQRDANALLIAAAPELLAALKDRVCAACFHDACDNARRIIAKAEGRP